MYKFAWKLKKDFLRVLPDKLRMAIQEETCDTVKKIWLDFHKIYQTISKDNPTEHDIEHSHQQAKDWINLFLLLNGKRKGYNRTRLTPYMHILVYHVPVFLKQYSTLKVFTGQGVEKKNDVARSVVMRKSNKWDSARDVLMSDSRQMELGYHERMKRPYRKAQGQYWETEIFESRRQKRNKDDNTNR